MALLPGGIASFVAPDDGHVQLLPPLPLWLLSFSAAMLVLAMALLLWMHSSVKLLRQPAPIGEVIAGYLKGNHPAMHCLFSALALVPCAIAPGFTPD